MNLNQREFDAIKTDYMNPISRNDPESMIFVAESKEEILYCLDLVDIVVRWIRSEEDMLYMNRLANFYWVNNLEHKVVRVSVDNEFKDISSTKYLPILQQMLTSYDEIPKLYRDSGLFTKEWYDWLMKNDYSLILKNLSEELIKKKESNIVKYLSNYKTLI